MSVKYYNAECFSCCIDYMKTKKLKQGSKYKLFKVANTTNDMQNRWLKAHRTEGFSAVAGGMAEYFIKHSPDRDSKVTEKHQVQER